jgi:MFS family permease
MTFFRFGRKKTFIGFSIISTIFLVVLVATEFTGLTIDHPVLITVLSLSARYFISAGFGVLSCFTAESFPTVGRVCCMGLCALFGNIGGILAPQFAFAGTSTFHLIIIHFLRKHCPHLRQILFLTVFKSSHFISFGALNLITVIVSLKLKDRTGKPLQDSGKEDEA